MDRIEPQMRGDEARGGAEAGVSFDANANDGLIARLARFAVVGAIGFVIDTGTTLSLIAVGVSPFAARIPGLGAALLATWMLNRTATFRAARRTTLIGSLSRYLLVAGSVALVNYALYSLLLGVGLSPLGAIVLATACSLVLSYLGYGRFAFRATVAHREPD